MQPLEIFATQLLFSLLVYALLAKWLVLPKLRALSKEQALFWLMLPHTSRHIGLSFLVPGLAAGPLEPAFSMPTAYGDFITAILAVLSLVLLRAKHRLALALVWITNIFGTADLLKALSNPDMVPYLGANWYIPTMWVPLLLVSHFLIFKQLLSQENMEPASV